jgi:hypothetical protein
MVEQYVYHIYGNVGHLAYICKKNWQDKRGGNPMPHLERDMEINWSEMIAPLCATQVEGHAFLCILDRPFESNARERVSTAIIIVLKGEITSKQLEDEFTRIMPKQWRWTARKVADNMFTARFPNATLIQEWGCFNPISLRSVKAKIKIDPWNGSIGAKTELQTAWFRVRGVPYDKRSATTMVYVGSPVGVTVGVDKSTLSRTDYVRIKIMVRDITKVPAVAEGALKPFLYDFHYEREVAFDHNE